MKIRLLYIELLYYTTTFTFLLSPLTAIRWLLYTLHTGILLSYCLLQILKFFVRNSLPEFYNPTTLLWFMPCSTTKIMLLSGSRVAYSPKRTKIYLEIRHVHRYHHLHHLVLPIHWQTDSWKTCNHYHHVLRSPESAWNLQISVPISHIVNRLCQKNSKHSNSDITQMHIHHQLSRNINYLKLEIICSTSKAQCNIG